MNLNGICCGLYMYNVDIASHIFSLLSSLKLQKVIKDLCKNEKYETQHAKT